MTAARLPLASRARLALRHARLFLNPSKELLKMSDETTATATAAPMATSETFKRQQALLAEKMTEAAETSRASFGAAMSELVRLQAEEIERLSGIISDATTLPERQITQIAVGHSTAPAANTLQHSTEIVALDDHGALWRLAIMGRDETAWRRLPALPSHADLADRAAKEAENAASRARHEAEMKERAGRPW